MRRLSRGFVLSLLLCIPFFGVQLEVRSKTDDFSAPPNRSHFRDQPHGKDFGTIIDGRWTVPRPDDRSVASTLLWVDQAEESDVSIIKLKPELEKVAIADYPAIDKPDASICIIRAVCFEKMRIRDEAFRDLKSHGPGVVDDLVDYLSAPRTKLWEHHGACEACRHVLISFGAASVEKMLSAMENSNNKFCKSDFAYQLFEIGQPTFDRLSYMIAQENLTMRNRGIDEMFAVVGSQNRYGQKVNFDLEGMEFTGERNVRFDDLTTHLSTQASQIIEGELAEAVRKYHSRLNELQPAEYSHLRDDPELKTMGARVVGLIRCAGYITSPSRSLLTELKNLSNQSYKSAPTIYSSIPDSLIALSRIALNNHLDHNTIDEIACNAEKNYEQSEFFKSDALHSLVLLTLQRPDLRGALTEAVDPNEDQSLSMLAIDFASRAGEESVKQVIAKLLSLLSDPHRNASRVPVYIDRLTSQHTSLAILALIECLQVNREGASSIGDQAFHTLINQIHTVAPYSARLKSMANSSDKQSAMYAASLLRKI